MIHGSGLLALFTTTAICIQSAREFILNQVESYKDLTAYKVVKTIVKLPYELVLTYASIIESYADEYKMEHDGKEPTWDKYPYFCFASVWYIWIRMTGYLHECIRERYRDKTLRDSVTQVDEHTIEVVYEWKKHHYVVQVVIDKMQMREFVSAVATLPDGSTLDVTKKVKELLGPLEDWHSISYTPRKLGWTKLILTRFDSVQLSDVATVVHADEPLLKLH